ncbi:SRPBCC family protein [Amycolatopsis nigrescens]|uniref:SRPBCC family protein n=1 Tax=Amycolatopsis nigrescens TaxID=381445 RepID=UPI00035F2C35|nr:SRPBCC family protein [Amycolatopsis nigrescens]
MSQHRYRFRTDWQLRAPVSAVFAAAVDLANYPAWWPDVRAVRKVDEDTAELLCRSTLPYSLVLRMHRAEQDEPSGRLRVTLSGDLEGVLAGHVSARDGGTRLLITQEVVARKKLLRRLGPVARPLFEVNHTLMMRRGQRQLQAYLNGK